ncbi:MAG: hypothetical protein J6M24_03835 [Lachnospiraceae bacterium]|nr:hypothetical protein [Lachnospiraceae bacterium]
MPELKLSKLIPLFGKESDGGEKKVSPIRLELLITIVNRKKGDFFADLIQSFGANMQLVTAATGTAERRIIELLGLSGNEKAVVFSIVREDRLNDIQAALEDKFRTVKDGKGIAVALPFSSIMGVAAFGFLTGEEGI